MHLESVPSLFSCLSLEIGEVSVICNLGAKTRMLFNTTATRKVVYIIGQKQSVFRWKNISLRIKFSLWSKISMMTKNLSTTSQKCHRNIFRLQHRWSRKQSDSSRMRFVLIFSINRVILFPTSKKSAGECPPTSYYLLTWADSLGNILKKPNGSRLIWVGL